jgi:hypothetical protein
MVQRGAAGDGDARHRARLLGVGVEPAVGNFSAFLDGLQQFFHFLSRICVQNLKFGYLFF